MPIRKSDDAMYEEDAPMSKGDRGAVAATLPKSLLMGRSVEPGDEVVLRIDAVHDNEVVVSYPMSDEADAETMAEGEMTAADESAMAGVAASDEDMYA